MARILVCGLSTADFVFNVTALPERAEKYIATNAEMIIGGGAANAAIAIARQQGSVSLAARIGDDWIGKAVVQTLSDENIDMSFLQICRTATTSYSSVLVDSAGERQIVNFRGSGFDQRPTWLSNDVPPKFSNNNTGQSIGNDSPSPASHPDKRPFDAVLADTRWAEGAVAILQMARRTGIPGVVDAEAPINEQILDSASHVAFSVQGLHDYTGGQDTQQSLFAASSKLDAWVCVTDGSNGVFYMHNGKIRHSPTHQVEVRDTLAAGDVWHGVFTLALGQGRSEPEAIAYANAAASLKCAGMASGAMGAPDRDQTQQLMNDDPIVGRDRPTICC